MVSVFLFWLLFSLPGFALLNRIPRMRPDGGDLGAIGVSYLLSLLFVTPFSIIGYWCKLPLAFLSIAIGLTIAFSAFDLFRTRRQWMPQLPRPDFLFISGFVILFLFLVDAALVGSHMSNDADYHLARIRFIFENGFSNADPYLGIGYTVVYHTNVYHALIAAASQLSSVDILTFWFWTSTWAKLVTASSIYLLTYTIFRRRFSAWLSALWFLGVDILIYRSLYPNQIAPHWLIPIGLAFMIKAFDKNGDALPNLLAVGAVSFLVGQVHSLYAVFFGLSGCVGAGAFAVDAAFRDRRSERLKKLLIAFSTVVAVSAAAPFLIIYQYNLFPKELDGDSAKKVTVDHRPDAKPPSPKPKTIEDMDTATASDPASLEPKNGATLSAVNMTQSVTAGSYGHFFSDDVTRDPRAELTYPARSTSEPAKKTLLKKKPDYWTRFFQYSNDGKLVFPAEALFVNSYFLLLIGLAFILILLRVRDKRRFLFFILIIAAQVALLVVSPVSSLMSSILGSPWILERVLDILEITFPVVAVGGAFTIIGQLPNYAIPMVMVLISYLGILYGEPTRLQENASDAWKAFRLNITHSISRNALNNYKKKRRFFRKAVPKNAVILATPQEGRRVAKLHSMRFVMVYRDNSVSDIAERKIDIKRLANPNPNRRMLRDIIDRYNIQYVLRTNTEYPWAETYGTPVRAFDNLRIIRINPQKILPDDKRIIVHGTEESESNTSIKTSTPQGTKP
jgi:hypothetical protein